MKPTKAYILRIPDPRSIEYAKGAAKSCDEVGLPWEYVEGYTEQKNLWENFFLKTNKPMRSHGKGGCATASHIYIWDKIANGNECCVVLEHDAVMLHPVGVEIPDNTIVALGYKVKDPENYDHIKAGPPDALESRSKHGGAHAYCITPHTAQKLIDNIKRHGLNSMVDNTYFLRQSKRPQLEGVDLAITNPIAAIGWLRESTIWKNSAVDNYRPILQSFLDNYNSKQDMGLKG